MNVYYNMSPSMTSLGIPSTQPKEQEKGHTVLFTITSLISLWIVIANLVVFSCVTTIRYSLRNCVYVQILALSVTDMMIGIFAFPVTLTYYIMGSFQQYSACAVIMSLYLVSQMANLYHSFGICIYRFITVRSRENLAQSSRSYIVCVQVIATWTFSVVCVTIMFALFGGDCGDELPYCSLNVLFGNQYERMLTYLCCLYVTPQLGMDVLYIYMCRYLVVNWRTTGYSSQKTTRANTDIYKNKSFINSNDMADANAGNSDSLDEYTRTSRTASEVQTDCSNTTKYINYHRNSLCTVTHRSVHNYWLRNIVDGFSSVFRRQARVTKHPKHSEQTERTCQMTKSQDHDSSLLAETSFIQQRGDDNNTTIVLPSKHINFNVRPIGTCSHRHQRSVLVTIGILCLIMNICVTPLTILFVLETAHADSLSRRTKVYCLTSALLNSALNPFVYAARIPPFRSALRRNWQRIFHCLFKQ